MLTSSPELASSSQHSCPLHTTLVITTSLQPSSQCPCLYYKTPVPHPTPSHLLFPIYIRVRRISVTSLTSLISTQYSCSSHCPRVSHYTVLAVQYSHFVKKSSCLNQNVSYTIVHPACYNAFFCCRTSCLKLLLLLRK